MKLSPTTFWNNVATSAAATFGLLVTSTGHTEMQAVKIILIAIYFAASVIRGMATPDKADIQVAVEAAQQEKKE